MTNIFFSGDHHFFHSNVLRYSNRPYKNVEDMEEDYIRKWNKVVDPRDTVYYLGDFTLDSRPDKIDAILGSLNGEIIFIRGNHDKWLSKLPRLQNRKKIKVVKDIHEISVSHNGENIKIVMMHYPMRTWNRSHYGSFHLHGHCHGSLNGENVHYRRMDVGVDTWDGYPVDLDTVISHLSHRPFTYHHGD